MNAKVFRKEIAKIKSNLTDKEVFDSEGFRKVCSNIVIGVSKAWDTRVNVILGWHNPDGPVAFANEDGVVYLNLNTAIVQKMNRREKYEIYIALLLHECGHRLFTDFKEDKRRMEEIINYGVISDKFPDLTQKLSDYPALREPTAELAHRFLNCVEDGHIELRLLSKFRGYGKYLKKFRSPQMKQATPIVEMLNNGLDNVNATFNALLMYAKYGKILWDTDSDDLPSVIMAEIHKDIDKARLEKNAKKRISICLETFGKAYRRLLEDYENNRPADSELQDGNGESSSPNLSGEEQNGSSSGQSETDFQQTGQPGSLENSDEIEDGDGNASSESSDDQDGTPEEEKSSQSDVSVDSDEPEEDDDGDSNEVADDQDETLEEKGAESNSESNSYENSEETEELSKEEKAATAAAFGKILEDALNGLSDMGKEEVFDGQDNLVKEQGKVDDVKTFENSDEVPDDNSKSSGCDKLEEEIAESMAKDTIEENQKHLDNTLKDNMPLNDIHINVQSEIIEIEAEASKDYEELLFNSKAYLRRLVQEFMRKIKDMQAGSKLNGLYFGRRVDQPYRADLKRFANRKSPENIPCMSLFLLIDESGSMGGERIQKARETAMLLYLFCREIGIRVSIYGHGTFAGKVHLYKYTDFDSFCDRDLLRISQMTDHAWSNRDGYAIRFGCEKLLQETSDDKIFMIISDGSPNDTGYGYCRLTDELRAMGYTEEGNAKVDIQDILRTYGKKGISFITASIGNEDDAVAIKDLYTDGLAPKVSAHYLDVSDLEKLPKTMVGVLKKIIDI